MTQYLYRFFDQNDDLLYVGVSVNALARLAQHKLDKPWIDEVVKVTIESHEVSRQEIERIERNAIQDEKPRHNKVHNQGSPGSQMDADLLGFAQIVRRNEPHQHRPLRPGDVAAFGMSDGTCPVGIISADSISDPRVPYAHLIVHLMSFATGRFDAGLQVVDLGNLRRGMVAEPIGVSTTGERIYDTEALAEFQLHWN